MRGIIGVIVVLIGLSTGPALGDETLYRYEGNVLPYDPTAGWNQNNPCEDPCVESLDSGHFVLTWPDGYDFANYSYWIAQPPDDPPPPPFWVEWTFESDHEWVDSEDCDGRFQVHYGGMSDTVYMHGDAVFSHSGNDFVLGLDITEAQTYRYETPDGIDYRFSVDGQVFTDYAFDNPSGYHYIQFGGNAGCSLDQLPIVDEWDFVRYGTIDYGESIIATDPPEGYLDPAAYGNMTRFVVTYAADNYAYIDEISVEVTGGTAPEVIGTRRLDNSEPDTLQIVLDRPMPIGHTTTFTFDDGVRVQTVEYTLAADPAVPTVSAWGVIILTLLIATTGTILSPQRVYSEPRP
ncbi:MAG: hypothetical protein JSU63_05850 [Phycisphaerales bacterium]|nr:MAG: hypothetical protein JSU63_05850 [Phycisphaerales bacterium]